MNESILECPTSRSPRSDGPRLVGEVRRVGALDAGERAAMLALMETYFDGVRADVFERDLGEKEWAILLRAAGVDRVVGFSTVMRTSAVANGERVVGLFSGDTIVDREYWGESTLARVWSRHAFAVAASIHDARTYWFLICSGYKTYRFLPVFFRTFFPTYLTATPAREERIRTALAQAKFGAAFDRARGVVVPESPAPLASGVADVTAERRRDPHVAFFESANSGHARGDELVCLTELAPANLTAAGRRMVGPLEALDRVD